MSGFAEVDGGRLYYETAGDGPALVLIHAGFLDSRMWDLQFQLFSKSYKVIRYDVRGFGRSEIAKSSFSDSKDLYLLLNRLNVERISIIGVSNGGRIALDFVVDYPDMVSSIILVSPGVSGYKVSGPAEEKLWVEFEERMKPQEVADREGRAADAVEMDVEAWASAQNETSRQRIREIAMDNFHVHLENPWKFLVKRDPPTFQRLDDIRIPTLFIVGDRDVPPQIIEVDHLHSRIPGSNKIVIEGADHIPNMSRPEEFERIVLRFLEDQKLTVQP
ncbi:MAG TPA: alpha/beta hydrolase [Candidatus Dormibacteraeota bacterium]|jgi:pimeloyl-ACP methyl ester carboxylesterase|nr:alpha/beta hydrolase [Candidatus Dormibacteraeota bacterium]